MYLEKLLKDNVEGYISSNSKREFVKERVLDKIPGGLRVSCTDLLLLQFLFRLAVRSSPGTISKSHSRTPYSTQVVW